MPTSVWWINLFSLSMQQQKQNNKCMEYELWTGHVLVEAITYDIVNRLQNFNKFENNLK